PQGHRRQTPDHPAAISNRGRSDLHDWRADWAWHRLAADPGGVTVSAGNDVVHHRRHCPAGFAGHRPAFRNFPRLARGADGPGGRIEERVDNDETRNPNAERISKSETRSDIPRNVRAF